MRITAENWRRHRTAIQPASSFVFYLGTHEPSWLARVRFPLFISHRRLRQRQKLPRARCTWALDSGAFSELSRHGRWITTPEEYVSAVQRYQTEIRNLAWAAPQDWMCEPSIIELTGLSVKEHQQRTVENYLRLKQLAPNLPFIPVLQGWTIQDYKYCYSLYSQAGVDLTEQPLVGLGSICRRQATVEIDTIVTALHSGGLRLHGFGVKTGGLRRFSHHLASADSMAWSFRGRYIRNCRHRDPGKRAPLSEANCLHFARAWRRRAYQISRISI